MTAIARNQSFERIAANYDAVRPGYPDALYDRIVEFVGLKSDTRVLEVGLGTGRATTPLAERGFEILGIEPGAELSSIARTNLARFPRVSVVTNTFEAWAIEGSAFGLAFSAQAFHWLDPSLRLTRFAQALHPKGVLAVFGNVPRVPAGPMRDDLDAAYRDFAPSLSSSRETNNWYGTADSPVMAELSASQFFRDIEFSAFTWNRELDCASYCQFLSTYSDHSTLPPAELQALLARVADIVGSYGVVSLSYTTGLFLARRSDEAFPNGG